jgi:hypothetical protein
MRKLTRTIALVGAFAVMATATGQVVGRPVAHAGSQGHFEIFFRHLDELVTMGRYNFPQPLWEFGDRPGYRCAWAFLIADGVRVARVQFDRGQTYTQINDAFGDENSNDFSQCIPSEERELKAKPAGLGDTTVDFVLGGVPLTNLTFPATSPTDSDSWWEFEESTGGVVELELYWQEDVAVVATLTSLTEALDLSVRSSSGPTINSFAPGAGGPGTKVDVLGSNFIDVTSVTFNGVAATFESKSGSELVATVPSGAATGPIRVATPSGTAVSGSDFSVTSGVSHASTVTLGLSGNLVASGRVRSPGAPDCRGGRTVVVERRVSGDWRNMGSDKTSNNGTYREPVNDVAGTYRARVEKLVLPNGEVCRADTSPTRVN